MSEDTVVQPANSENKEGSTLGAWAVGFLLVLFSAGFWYYNTYLTSKTQRTYSYFVSYECMQNSNPDKIVRSFCGITCNKPLSDFAAVQAMADDLRAQKDLKSITIINFQRFDK